MSDQSLTETIRAEMKAAMKARDKDRLGTIRLIQAEFKRIEVDERIDVDDARALAVLDKMVKQRRESIAMYETGGRQELADAERAEVAVIERFLPAQMDEEQTTAAILAIKAELGAEGMKDMGRVMAELKARHASELDMSKASGLVKAALA